MTGVVLSSTVFANSGLLNDLAIDVGGTFWAHGGPALFHYDASGTLLGTHAINLGADTIKGSEIAQGSTPCVNAVHGFTADRSGAFPIDRMQVVALYDGAGANAEFDIELWNPTTGACCIVTIDDLENLGHEDRSTATTTGSPNFVGGWPLAFNEGTWDARLNEILQRGTTGFVARRQAQITLSGAQLVTNGTWGIPTG